MAALEEAKAVLEDFKRVLNEGHPWLPGNVFIRCPGLDLYVQAALEGFVYDRQVAENAKPAKRVSLSDNPNWRPSSVEPMSYEEAVDISRGE